MLRRAAGALLTVALLAPPLSAQQAYQYESYTLDNGLRVVLSEDHAAAVVAVNIWFDVGSRHEKLGRSGFAHDLSRETIENGLPAGRRARMHLSVADRLESAQIVVAAQQGLEAAPVFGVGQENEADLVQERLLRGPREAAGTRFRCHRPPRVKSRGTLVPQNRRHPRPFRRMAQSCMGDAELDRHEETRFPCGTPNR